MKTAVSSERAKEMEACGLCQVLRTDPYRQSYAVWAQCSAEVPKYTATLFRAPFPFSSRRPPPNDQMRVWVLLWIPVTPCFWVSSVLAQGEAEQFSIGWRVWLPDTSRPSVCPTRSHWCWVDGKFFLLEWLACHDGRRQSGRVGRTNSLCVLKQAKFVGLGSWWLDEGIPTELLGASQVNILRPRAGSMPTLFSATRRCAAPNPLIYNLGTYQGTGNMPKAALKVNRVLVDGLP
jgi:hypothetical protein